MRRGTVIAGRFSVIRELCRIGGRSFLECIDRAAGRGPASRVLIAPFFDLPYPAQQRRTEHERAIMARLSSPAALAPYDAVDTGTESFAAFSTVAGLSPLAGSTRRMPYHHVARLLGELGRFAIGAHDRGVLLRLLLPGHLMTAGDGPLRIIDCSWCIAGDDDAPETAATLPATPFAAPELSASWRPTTASDVYALAMIAACLLAGSVPKAEKAGDAARIGRKLVGVIRKRYDNPEWIEPLRCALLPEPSARPKDAQALFSQLLPDDDFTEPHPAPAEEVLPLALQLDRAKGNRAAMLAALREAFRLTHHGIASSLSDDDVRALVSTGHRRERAEAAELLMRMWAEARMTRRLEIVERCLPQKLLTPPQRSLLEYARALRAYTSGDVEAAAAAIQRSTLATPARRNLEGMIAQRLRRLPEAAKAYADAAGAADHKGDRLDAAIFRGNLALARQMQGRYDEAWTLYEHALSVLRTAGRPAALAAAQHNQAGLAVLVGDFGAAKRLLAASLAISRKQGLLHQEAQGLLLSAEMSKFRGDVAAQHDAAKQALAIFSDLRDARQTARALAQLGWCALRRGNSAALRDILVRLRAFADAHPAEDDAEIRMLHVCFLRRFSPQATEHMLSLLHGGLPSAAPAAPPTLAYEWNKLLSYVLADAGRLEESRAAMRIAAEILAAMERAVPPRAQNYFRQFLEAERLAGFEPGPRTRTQRRRDPMPPPPDVARLFEAMHQALKGIVERMPALTQQRLFLKDIAPWLHAKAIVHISLRGGTISPVASVGDVDVEALSREIRNRLSKIPSAKRFDLTLDGSPTVALCAPTSSGRELTGCVIALLPHDAPAPSPAVIDCFQGCADMLEVIGMTAFAGTPASAADPAPLLPAEKQPGAERFLFGASAAMDPVKRLAHQAASSRHAIIISGGPGTGKRTLAEHLHALSSAAFGKAVVDCREADARTLYDEIFGTAQTPGAIERARGGTVILLHLERLDLALQQHLISFLQDGCYRPAGADAFKEGSVRFIATAYENFWDAVDAGRISSQLLSLLGGVRIAIPALSQRLDDVESLAAEFFASRGIRKKLCASALRELKRIPWTSNTAEFFRTIENAASLSSGSQIDGAAIQAMSGASRPANLPPSSSRATLGELLREVEKEAIESALASYGHDKDLTARALGISKPGLYKKMKEYNLATEKVTKEQLLAILKACAGNKKRAARQLGISRKTLYNKMEEYHLKF